MGRSGFESRWPHVIEWMQPALSAAPAAVAAICMMIHWRSQRNDAIDHLEAHRQRDRLEVEAARALEQQRKLERARIWLLGQPEPPEPEDTSWMDIVGIPFEVWTAAGECHGDAGYTFAPGVVPDLARRRDAGEYLPPPPPTAEERREAWRANLVAYLQEVESGPIVRAASHSHVVPLAASNVGLPLMTSEEVDAREQRARQLVRNGWMTHAEYWRGV